MYMTSKEVDPTTLKVSLYPVIPKANERLLEVIKTEFEKRNPDIKLELRSFTSEGDYYNETYLESLFTKEGYDIIEIDNMFLGHFINNDLLEEFEYDYDDADWHDYAKSIIEVGQRDDKKRGYHYRNKRIYGIPHWLCKSFIFSRDQKIEDPIKIDRYFKENSARFPDKPMFAGAVIEPWLNSLMYFGSCAYDKLNRYSSYNETWDRLYNLPILQSGSSSLDTFSRYCVLDNDKQKIYEKQVEYFTNYDLPYQNFIQDKAVTFSAFGEVIHTILSDIKGGEKIYLNDMRYTNRNYQRALPMTSLDVLILRKNVTKEKRRSVYKFLKFFNSYEITKLISLQKDSLEPNPIPRFLFPAHIGHASKLIGASRQYGEYYRKFEFHFSKGSALPINGFTTAKQSLYPHLFSSLFGDLPIPVLATKRSQGPLAYHQRYLK